MIKREPNREMRCPWSRCPSTPKQRERESDLAEAAHLGKGPEEDDALGLVQLAPGSQLLAHAFLQLRLRKREGEQWTQRKDEERRASGAHADDCSLHPQRRSPRMCHLWSPIPAWAADGGSESSDGSRSTASPGGPAPPCCGAAVLGLLLLRPRPPETLRRSPRMASLRSQSSQ